MMYGCHYAPLFVGHVSKYMTEHVITWLEAYNSILLQQCCCSVIVMGQCRKFAAKKRNGSHELTLAQLGTYIRLHVGASIHLIIVLRTLHFGASSSEPSDSPAPFPVICIMRVVACSKWVTPPWASSVYAVVVPFQGMLANTACVRAITTGLAIAFPPKLIMVDSSVSWSKSSNP